MFCNKNHPAVAFIGPTCPVCIHRAAPGANLGTSSLEVLKTWLRRELGISSERVDNEPG
jgi:hypothetical protein